MIRYERDASHAQARELVRRLRDLCLGPCRIELRPGRGVRLSGCLSADQPVERGVCYGLEHADGRRSVLATTPRGSALELSVVTEGARDAEPAASREIALYADRYGRVTAPALGARLDLALCDAREVERFLRRLVRGAIDGAAA